MKIKFLGSGSAIPLRGVRRNKRTPASFVVSYSGKNVLVDPTPMVKDQLSQNYIVDIHAIIITHAHSKASGGLGYCIKTFKDIPVYASQPNLTYIENLCGYTLPNKHYFSAGVPFTLFGAKITPVGVIHTEVLSKGCNHSTTAIKINKAMLAKDVYEIPPESECFFDGLDFLAIDSLTYFKKTLRGHMSIEQAIGCISKYKPYKAVLTHIGKSFPEYNKANKRIRTYCYFSNIHSDVEIGYDGMEIDMEQLSFEKGKRGELKRDIRIVHPHGERFIPGQKMWTTPKGIF